MSLRDMLEKSKYGLASSFERRVFVGGNYDFMPILREICNHVKQGGFEPVLAFDFDAPKEMIYAFDIGLLQECKYAVFEVSSGNGHMMELQEAIRAKKMMFCLYGVRGRKHAKPSPAVSSMLTSSDVVLLGYDSLRNLEDIILTIFPAVEEDLSSVLLEVLKIAHVRHGTRSRIISTLEMWQLSMNEIPSVAAQTMEKIAQSLSAVRAPEEKLSDTEKYSGFRPPHKRLLAIAEVIMSQLKTIQDYGQMINDPSTLELNKIHKLLSENIWLIDDRYSLYASNENMETIIKREFRKSCKMKDRRRPDLICKTQGNKHVIVELKRPFERIRFEHLPQLLEYVSIAKNYYPNSELVEGVCVGSEFDEKLRAEMLPPRISLRSYTEILDDVRFRRRQYFEHYGKEGLS